MTASTIRPLRASQPLRIARQCLSQQPKRNLVTTSPAVRPPTHTRARLATSLRPISEAASVAASPATAGPAASVHRAALHTSGPPLRRRAHNNEEIPTSAPTTDFSRLDMLGAAPAPSTSVDICSSDGFKLNSGVSVYHGRGVLLVGGEAFEWQPWGPDLRLINAKGQWELPEGSLSLLELLWPRPGMLILRRRAYICVCAFLLYYRMADWRMRRTIDLLILGLGPQIRPLSPATRRYISSMGLRVEVLDTRNAASQFNMLATERGVDDVAAALIPIGWKEGIGADWE